MASKEDAAERVFDQVNWQRIARRMTVIHGQSHWHTGTSVSPVLKVTRYDTIYLRALKS